MATRASIENSRPNLLRRHSREESASQRVLCSSFIIMMLVSFTRGMILNTGVNRYSSRLSYHRVAPFTFVKSQQQRTCLSSVAHTRTDGAPSAESLTTSEDEQIIRKQPWKTLFDLELPEGRCLGLRIDADDPSHLSPETIESDEHWIHACLHPDEVKYAMARPSEYTQQTFLLGRLAMRQVLDGENEQHAILKDDHGRPHVPPGYLGSISHKRSDGTTAGVALIAPISRETIRMGVGVDIEQAASRKRSIAKRVLTEDEMNDLGRIEGVTKDEEVLLRFSLKEAFYKAIHPLICQYVGFQEAEVIPHQDGTATVNWNLKSGAHVRFQNVTGHWRRIDEFFLSSACVTLGDNEDECVMNESQ